MNKSTKINTLLEEEEGYAIDANDEEEEEKEDGSKASPQIQHTIRTTFENDLLHKIDQ